MSTANDSRHISSAAPLPNRNRQSMTSGVFGGELIWNRRYNVGRASSSIRDSPSHALAVVLDMARARDAIEAHVVQHLLHTLREQIDYDAFRVVTDVAHA